MDYKIYDVNFLETTFGVYVVSFSLLWDAHFSITCDTCYSVVSQDIKASIGHGAKFLQFFIRFLLYSNRRTCLENADKGAQTCKERVLCATCSWKTDF